MSEKQDGLPPRRSRSSQPKSSITLKKVVQSGLVVFGALFFGLIGLELYQAKMANKPVVSVSLPVIAEEANSRTPSVSDQALEPSGKPDTAPKASVLAPTKPETVPSVPNHTGSHASPNIPAQTKTQVPQTGTGSHAGAGKPSGNSTQPANIGKGKPGASAEKSKAVKHIVGKGETLYMLSRKYYGNNSGVSRIARYNGFHVETQLMAGKVVLIPISL